MGSLCTAFTERKTIDETDGIGFDRDSALLLCKRLWCDRAISKLRSSRDNICIRVPLLSYGREQRPPAWNSVNLPQRTCFRRWLGQDILWPNATRSRPDFLCRGGRPRAGGECRLENAQAHDSRDKLRFCPEEPMVFVSGAVMRRYRGDMKLSCDCNNRRLLASAGAERNGAERPSSEQEQAT